MKNLNLNKLAGIICGLIFSLSTLSAQTDLSVRISKSFDLSSEENHFMNARTSSGDFNVAYLGRGNTQSIGLQAKKTYGFLFVSAGADYRKTSFDYSVTSFMLENPAVQSEININKTMVSLPVIAGLQFNKFNIGVGPVFDFVLAESLNDTASPLFTTTDRSQYTQFQFVAGYEFFNRLEVGVRYERALYQAKNQFLLDGNTSKLTESPDMISLSLAVKFN